MNVRRINWRQAAIHCATAGLTLVEPRRLTGWKRHAYWAAVSALVGAAAASDADEPFVGDLDDGEYGWYAYAPLSSREEKASAFLATAGITFGLQEPLLALDAWSMHQLEERGIRHGRIWAAALTAVVGAAAVVVDARQRPTMGDVVGGHAAEEDQGEDREPVSLGPRVRQVAAELLARCDDWGAPALREQLASARQYPETEQGAIRFVIDDDTPRSPVPDYWFPVIGRGRVDGADVVVVMRIEDGRLAECFCEDLEGEFHRLPDVVTVEVGLPEGGAY